MAEEEYYEFDGDDEQQNQKVKSKMESLQIELDDLRKQLLEEREMHELTKQSLSLIREDSVTASLESMSVTSQTTVTGGGSTVKLDQPNSHSINKSAAKTSAKSHPPSSSSGNHSGHNSARGTTGGSGDLSMELKTELFRFCTRHAIATSVESVKAISEADAIHILRTASKLLKTGQISGDSEHGGEGPGAAGGASARASDGLEGTNDVQQKIRELERELRLALGAAEDIRALKAKVIQMIDRTRYEKELKLRAEAELAVLKKKMEIVADHMEKLMSNLKHEATAKIRSLEQLRVSENSVASWRERCEAEQRRSAAKDRLIGELREASKILEDQLRLMDEKYLELRIKLDWTRENGLSKLKKAEKMCSTLRRKFVMATGGMGPSLDSIVLPSLDEAAAGSAGSAGGGGISVNSSMYSASELSMGNSSSYSKHKKKPKKLSSLHSSNSASNLSNSNSRIRFANERGGNDDESEGALTEVTFEQIQDKLNRKMGEKEVWTEQKARELARTR